MYQFFTRIVKLGNLPNLHCSYEPSQYSEVQARAMNCLETFISLTLNQRHYQSSVADTFKVSSI